MQVYFDNAATTKICKEALEAYTQTSEQFFANPNSAHGLGFAAEQELAGHRAKVASLLNVPNFEVEFTSSGSAANALAILCAMSRSGGKGQQRKMLSSLAEHSSVLNTCGYLTNIGHEVEFISLNIDGSVNLECLEAAIDEHTALVSFMHVNNETGVIADIEAIHKVVKSKDARIVLHVDSVAGFGKHSLDMRFVDILTFAGHKFGGPKGIGGICYSKAVAPLFDIKADTTGVSTLIRQGTPDLPAVAAYAKAAETAYSVMRQNVEHVAQIKDYIVQQMRERELPFAVNGEGDVSPYILNMSFEGIRSETLINSLSSRGVYIAAGASCSSRSADKNILKHYGLSKERADSSVRLSFSASNTLAEAEHFVDELAAALKVLRKFSKKK